MRKRMHAESSDQVIPSPAAKFTEAKLLVQPSPRIKKYIFLLALPLIFAVITFFIGIVVMASGDPSHNPTVMAAAVAALVITTSGYIMIPSYLTALITYAVVVKKRKSDPLKTMWLIPFVQALFVWYPSFTKLPPEGRTVSTFLGLVFSVFLITVIWIGLLQLLIFIRRKWFLRKGIS